MASKKQRRIRVSGQAREAIEELRAWSARHGRVRSIAHIARGIDEIVSGYVGEERVRTVVEPGKDLVRK